MFIEQTLDARIEAALPTLAKIQQRGNAMKEAQIFENWVNGIMEGTWALPDTPEAQAKLDELMSQELIVGPDATNATEQLYDVIGDDKLFDILADLAEQDPRANCWDDTDVQARLQELGIQMNTTPDAEQQQPVAPAAGQQAPGTAPEQGVAEGVARSFDPQLIQILKQRRYKGIALGKAKKWLPSVQDIASKENFSVNANDIMMVSGSDPDYDPWILYVPSLGKYIYNEGGAYNVLTAKQVVKFTVPEDHDQFFEGVAEDQLDELSPTTLSSYARKAKGQAGWAAGVSTAAPGYKDQLTRGGEVVRQQHIVPGSEADQYDKLAKRRYAGARQAVGKGANVNPGNVEPYDWAKQGGYGDATNPAIRKRGMAENTELATMLKYAGVPISESRIHENSEYTHEIIAKTLAREKPGMETLRTSKDFYSAVYHELIAIGMTPRSARNLISYDEDFMGDVATSYNHYQSNPGLDEDNVSMMPEADPIATVEAMPELSNPVVEGSCNSTMEGEYCPEHGLAECGMYEMGTVAGSMAPVIGEAPQDPINYNGAITGSYYESKSDTALLARIKSLALLK